ncbi:MAG: hypothetical protein L3K17_10040 [Thermoplasmata archaeon]|nr:hypothetical protein [Thermoplasmata archaeon]
MPKRSGKAKQRTRHSARKWIIKALEGAKGSAAMRTSEIMKRASQLSGSEIPGYSVYQALRTLVKREIVAAKREGREFSYRLKASRGKGTAPSPAPTLSAPIPAVAPVAVAAAPSPIVHTLAPGEVAILHVGDTHIEAASNVHGKLVLERHRRPT